MMIFTFSLQYSAVLTLSCSLEYAELFRHCMFLRHLSFASVALPHKTYFVLLADMVHIACP